ncbi:MAG: two-component system sensor histidine kinase NtrB [Alphaproteobacteria bacterium]
MKTMKTIKQAWLETALSSEDALDALSDAILIVGPQGAIRWVNVAAEGLFRLSRARMLEMSLAELVSEDHPIAALLKRHIVEATTTMARDIALHPKHTSTTHMLDVQIMPLRGDDQQTRYILTLREQNIHLVQTWDENINGENQIELMASVLSHEIRNPLAGIRGAAQLLQGNLDEDDKALADIIIEEVDRINRFVGQLQAADFNQNEFAPLNIHKVLNIVARNLRSQFGDQFYIVEDFDPSLPEVLGHEDSLVRMFINIARNAVEALPEKNGRITVRTYWNPGVRFRQSSQLVNSTLPLIVEVEDNGMGIAKEMQSRMFDPFVTSKKNGSGLGLALAAKIMSEHHGFIECDSTQGRTIFRVRFPVYQPKKGIRENNAT